VANWWNQIRSTKMDKPPLAKPTNFTASNEKIGGKNNESVVF